MQLGEHPHHVQNNTRMMY